MFFKHLMKIDDLGLKFFRSFRIVHQITDFCKIIQRTGEEPAQPNALASAVDTDPVHAIIPVMSAYQRNTMRTGCDTFGERTAAMFIERFHLAEWKLPVTLVFIWLQRLRAQEGNLLI